MRLYDISDLTYKPKVFLEFILSDIFLLFRYIFTYLSIT